MRRIRPRPPWRKARYETKSLEISARYEIPDMSVDQMTSNTCFSLSNRSATRTQRIRSCASNPVKMWIIASRKIIVNICFMRTAQNLDLIRGFYLIAPKYSIFTFGDMAGGCKRANPIGCWRWNFLFPFLFACCWFKNAVVGHVVSNQSVTHAPNVTHQWRHILYNITTTHLTERLCW